MLQVFDIETAGVINDDDDDDGSCLSRFPCCNKMVAMERKNKI